jgi:hypothetical protein
MKINRLALTVMIGIGSSCVAMAQAPYDQYLMSWTATGYTTTPQGTVAVTPLTQREFVLRVAADNGLNANDLCFVYRAEKRDMAVVERATGAFIADVYQMEYTYTDVTNASDTLTYRQAFLNDEYHTNATGSTFGVESKIVNKAGNLASYSYHGTFQYAMPGPPTPLDPEVNTVWVGTFMTGARVPYTLPITYEDFRKSRPGTRQARVSPLVGRKKLRIARLLD